MPFTLGGAGISIVVFAGEFAGMVTVPVAIAVAVGWAKIE
jgi:hypothetical protein